MPRQKVRTSCRIQRRQDNAAVALRNGNQGLLLGLGDVQGDRCRAGRQYGNLDRIFYIADVHDARAIAPVRQQRFFFP